MTAIRAEEVNDSVQPDDAISIGFSHLGDAYLDAGVDRFPLPKVLTQLGEADEVVRLVQETLPNSKVEAVKIYWEDRVSYMIELWIHNPDMQDDTAA